MKKTKWKVLSLVLFFAIVVTQITSMALAATFSVESSRERLLIQIPYGENENCAAISGSVEKKEEIVGPNSFSIAEDGTFFILDTCNYRVIHYAKDGVILEQYGMPHSMWGLDMEVCGDDLYVLCDDYCIYYISMLEVDSKWTKIGAASVTSISSLCRENNIVYGRAWDGQEVYVTEQKTLASCPNIDLGYDEKVSKGYINKQGIHYSLDFQAEPIGAYIIKTIDNSAYILEQEALLRNNPYVEMRIGKYCEGSKAETAILRPLTGCMYVPFRCSYVTDLGNVYQLYPKAEGLCIYEIPWASGERTNITPEMIALDAIKNPIASNPTKSTTYATRATALTRAHNMQIYAWYYDASVNHTPSTSTKTSPVHLTSSNSGNQTGIPYCWGGMNGIDTGTYTGSTSQYMKNFSDALSGGQTAGNINTSSSGFVSGTAGLDCTGFVSAAYQFTFKLGSNIPSYFTATTWADAVAGDVADGPTHAFMLKYKYSGGVGNYMMSTYESVNSGSKHAVIINYRYYNNVVSTYSIYGID